MYKVLIVDDEFLIVKSLKNRIRWKDCGFKVVGEAYNGLEAYEKILELKPDVVFTDIRMPGMGGLELVEKAFRQELDVKFIIVSGYAEFEYAQKALNFGVLGFCLKPFNVVETGELLRSVKLKLDKARLALENEFISLLDGSCSFNREACSDILCKLGFDIKTMNGFRAVVAFGEEELSLPEASEYLKFKSGRGKYIYLCSNAEFIQNICQCLSNLPNGLRGVGISRLYYKIDFLEEAVDEANISAAQYFITGRKGIYEYIEPDTRRFDKLLRDMKITVLTKNNNEIEHVLNYACDVLKEGDFNVRHALKLYNLLFYLLCQESGTCYDGPLESLQQLTGAYRDLYEMLSGLKAMLHSKEEEPGIADETGNETYIKVLNYLNQNYYKEISVQSIAEGLSVNPNYLSQLFRKHKGVTITEYLTAMRINQACSMLKTTDSAIYEIADFVGYNDYFYFAKVFKKITGTTPKAYRDLAGTII